MIRASALGRIALGVAAGLGGGVLIAGDTMGAVDPFYRYGREPRVREAPPLEPAPGPPAVSFTPVAWSGFAALPPERADGYDDPTLLGEAEYREGYAPDAEIAPPEPEPPADPSPAPEPIALAAEPPTSPPISTEQVAAPAPPLSVGE